jgi:hypothetical protein
VLTQPEATNCLGSLGVTINGDGKFSAKNFQTTDVIAMFMGQKQSIQLIGSDAALLEPDNDLASAQSSIDKNSAMTSGNERAVPSATAAEHRQAEHG